MNENDRRFFLKRFFSFNNNSTTSNGTLSNCNGSFEEEQEDSVDKQTVVKSASDNLPAITVENVDDKTKSGQIAISLPDEDTSSSPGPSIDDFNDIDVSTPSSTAPLIMHRMNAFDNESAKNLLQQQNSIELKPFRKKEVLIVDSARVSIVGENTLDGKSERELSFVESSPRYKAKMRTVENKAKPVNLISSSSTQLIPDCLPVLNLRYRLVAFNRLV